MGRLEGKTAVVLGASAEGGIGWRTAELFAKEGATVYVAARTLSGVENLARKIGGKAFRCDASDEDEIKAFANFAAAENGYIDIAINSAGLAYAGTIETLTHEALRKNTEVNYYGHLYFIRQMAAKMQAGGSITPILSVTGQLIQIGVDGYGFAKAASMHMVRYAAREYADRQIRINAINPGLVGTPMTKGLVENPEALKVYMRETPLGKVIDPMEIAEAALWLSAYAPSVTGITVVVDGGKHLGRSPLPWEMPTNTLDKSTLRE